MVNEPIRRSKTYLQAFLAALSIIGFLTAIVCLVAGAPTLAAQVFAGTVLAIAATVLGMAFWRH